jgi:hypothetical protein
MEKSVGRNASLVCSKQKSEMNCTHHSRHSISATQWDEFVHHSYQGGPFLLYDWMTTVFPEWEYLEVRTDENLLARFPLSPGRKWFWKYALQPLFCQHWGLVLSREITASETQGCLSLIQAELEKRFSLLTYYLSPFYPEAPVFSGKGWEITQRLTHHRALHPTPEEAFSAPAARQARKAEKAGFRIERTWSEDTFRELLLHNPGIMDARQMKLFLKLYAFLNQSQQAFSLLALSPDGQASAMGVFVLYQERLYYLAGAVMPEYRNSGVMTLLMQEAMKTGYEAGKTLMDFEGSMNPGIAKFFKGLGGVEKNYICISYNRMPFSKRWKK